MSGRKRNSRGRRQYEPPRISTAETWEASVKRVPLFFLDDDEFTAPENLPPAMGMRYLRNIADGMKEDRATALLLIEARGRDVFDVLCDTDEIGHQEMNSIIDRVMDIALAGTEGKSSPGPRS